jgi:hypothetical protein
VPFYDQAYSVKAVPATPVQPVPSSKRLKRHHFIVRVSQGEADAAQQGLEMEISSQWVHPGIHPGPNQSIRPFAIGLFQPLQSLNWLA